MERSERKNTEPTGEDNKKLGDMSTGVDTSMVKNFPWMVSDSEREKLELGYDEGEEKNKANL